MKRLSIILLLTLVAAFPAFAQDDDSNEDTSRTITVTGTGTVSGTPDIANIEIGVESRDADVTTAFQNSNATIEAVINALVELGIERADIRTSSINVFQDRSGGPAPGPAESGMRQEPASTFIVNNQIRITVRDIDLVADAINAAVNAGANQIYGLSFGIDDRLSLESDARAEAISDARARAEELAGLAGVELGAVVRISEASGGFNPFGQAAFAESRGGGGGAIVEPGQLSVAVTLQITFAIQ
jgi:uncharacterized protein